jgi:hypothetical protein
MNKPQQLLSCLALSLALSVVALETWQQGIVRIDSNAVYHCLINGAERHVQGTRVSLQIRQTSIVWMQCAAGDIRK